MLVHSAQPHCPLMEERMLKQRHSTSGPASIAPSANDAESELDSIPTIVLTPELAIQPLDRMFSQCTLDAVPSCCPDLPVLRATSIDGSVSSQTVLYTTQHAQQSNKKRQRAAFLSATVFKDTQEAALGLGIRKVHGVLQVSSLRPNCLLSEAPFQVGDKLISINNMDCAEKSLSAVAKLLKEATGLLTVVVEHAQGDPKLVESMIRKPTPTSKTGLGVANGTGQQIRVSGVQGLFASSLLSRRDTILAINGTHCEYLMEGATEAAKLIASSERTVTILAQRQCDNAAVVAAQAA